MKLEEIFFTAGIFISLWALVFAYVFWLASQTDQEIKMLQKEKLKLEIQKLKSEK